MTRQAYILGASGYVGEAIASGLAKRGFQTFGIGRYDFLIKFDLAEPNVNALEAIKPDSFVVVASAISNPDICESRYDEAYLVNVVGTRLFISHALNKGCRVVFLSSDAVFASEPEVTYDETSAVDPRFSYGKMKACVEHAFSGSPLFKTIRLSYVFSDHDNSTRYMLECLRSGKTAEIYHPYYRSYISLSDVVRAVCWLATDWEALPDWRLNLAGADLVSRVRAASSFRRLFPEFKYEIRCPPPSFYSSRPPITQTTSRYLYDLGICTPEPFEHKFKNEMKGLLKND